MLKIQILGFMYADDEATQYAEKIARKQYGDNYSNLPASSHRRLNFDFYVTPMQQWFFAFGEFLKNPLLNKAYRFDEDGRPVGVYLVSHK